MLLNNFVLELLICNKTDRCLMIEAGLSIFKKRVFFSPQYLSDFRKKWQTQKNTVKGYFSKWRTHMCTQVYMRVPGLVNTNDSYIQFISQNTQHMKLSQHHLSTNSRKHYKNFPCACESLHHTIISAYHCILIQKHFCKLLSQQPTQTLM